MKPVPTLIFHWPEIPERPPLRQPVLIRVVTAAARPAARRELRTVLRQVLARWSGRPPGQLPLRKTPTGPVWSGLLDGQRLDISLSHAEGEGWIGLLRGGWIGVDIMRIQSIPEAREVARHYLGPEAWKTIQHAADPALAFATAWTALEARLKCFKQPLREASGTSSPAPAECAIQSLIQSGGLLVSVATRDDFSK
jgi:4'-phosphopantetheinyl transferase